MVVAVCRVNMNRRRINITFNPINRDSSLTKMISKMKHWDTNQKK